MYSEKTEIVDVVAITANDSTTYALSLKAGDLYESALSGDVIRRHDISESAGVVNNAYIGLSEVKKDSTGFTFTFANGDTFTAATADAYPASDSVSDSSGGGSSGGAYLINYDFTTGALDKTWSEINAALSSGQIVEIVMDSGEELTYIEYVYGTDHNKFGYAVYGFGVNDTTFYADDPDDYPVASGDL